MQKKEEGSKSEEEMAYHTRGKREKKKGINKKEIKQRFKKERKKEDECNRHSTK